MSYKYYDQKGEHLHELDGKPLIGTSTALQVLSKPLTWWAAELAAVSALESGQHIPTIREEYEAACAEDDKKKAIDLLQKKYPAFKAARFAHFEKKNTAADKGTDMHEQLEKYVKLCISDNKGVPFDDVAYPDARVEMFGKWAKGNVKKFLVSEGHCYSTRLWTGGITDCIAELNDGKLAIIDFKSSKEAYQSQFFQCGGYDIEASENGLYDKDGTFLFKLEKPIDVYIVFPFGAKKVEPALFYDTKTAQQAFEACVVLTKIINQNG